jgi:hypothetical protein
MSVDALLHEIELNGAPAIVFSSQERPFVVIMIETEGGRIRRVYAIANPDKLGAVSASLFPDENAASAQSVSPASP